MEIKGNSHQRCNLVWLQGSPANSVVRAAAQLMIRDDFRFSIDIEIAGVDPAPNQRGLEPVTAEPKEFGML